MTKSLLADRVKRNNEKLREEAKRNKKRVANQKTQNPKEPKIFEEVVVAKESKTLML